jgi:hypothetical protein
LGTTSFRQWGSSWLGAAKRGLSRRFPVHRFRGTPSEGLFLFAIPLIAKKNSANWPPTIELLNETLASILNQTDKNYHVLIAANDDIRPLIPSDPRIEVKFFEGNKVGNGSISDPDHKWRGSDLGTKKLDMSKWGLASGARYIMYLDADDLVRRDLVQIIREKNPQVACILLSGFIENHATGNVLCMPTQHILDAKGQPLVFDLLCGSSIVLTYPRRAKDMTFLKVYDQGHHMVRINIRELNKEAVELSEPMVIYRINTGINTSLHHTNDPSALTWLANVIKRIDREGRSLTENERSAFGLSIASKTE